jgi:hypothetical protein
VLFMETAPGPHELEKLCFDVLRPGCVGMHYVTRRSHWMQKLNFGITCLSAVFM